MASRLLNRRDVEFMLYDWLDAESLARRPRFADHGRETFTAALDTAEQIASDLFAPHNKLSDQQEPQFDGERVTIELRPYAELQYRYYNVYWTVRAPQL